MLQSPYNNSAAPERTQAIVEMQSLSASGEQNRWAAIRTVEGAENMEQRLIVVTLGVLLTSHPDLTIGIPLHQSRCLQIP